MVGADGARSLLVKLEKTYSYNLTPDTLIKLGKDHFVKGVQCNLWSEYLYTTDILEYRAYPRVLALREIAWTRREIGRASCRERV